MKAERLMHNCIGDRFRVTVICKVNQVNGWSCTTLANAKRSVQLFFEQRPLLTRTRAEITDTTTKETIIIKNETTHDKTNRESH